MEDGLFRLFSLGDTQNIHETLALSNVPWPANICQSNTATE